MVSTMMENPRTAWSRDVDLLRCNDATEILIMKVGDVMVRNLARGAHKEANKHLAQWTVLGNPKMIKAYVWLQTSDGSIQQVEQEIAMFCPLICHEIIQKGMGSSKNYAICLPQRVSPAMLSLILDYCRFHQVPGRSNKERKSFDEKFIRMDTKRLCELTSAADSLQLKPLVDLTSRALARIIEGKTPEEIREIFHLPDDLTEEEKLEPLKNTTDDPRIRLLNRLYAKKRKELKERERLKNVEVEEEHVDERSVDDLLSFINGNDRDPKEIKTSKNRKKNRRKKDQQKNSFLKEASELDKETNGHNIRCQSAEADTIGETSNIRHTEDDTFSHKETNGHNIRCQSADADTIGETSNIRYTEDDTFAHKVEFDDGDMDDEIDPALQEKIDREVADFARRLNSDWPMRMKEFLSSSGQERTSMHFPTNGNSFLRRHDYPFLLSRFLSSGVDDISSCCAGTGLRMEMTPYKPIQMT
ncbi:SKP1-like protein 21 isoform X1 [Senna tora]|uniref:SKP1-like protein 21 isoform X1 n=1 Tax=Senna tora TaxID=362788 RepID=A0A834TSE4_9FABA|nr:SKP1-like protein 21 isoform X1 [Senna tora]